MTYKIVTMGGCGLTIPLGRMAKRKLVQLMFRKIGFSRSPLTLSSGSALQLLRFSFGELEIPAGLRQLCYEHSPERCSSDAAELLRQSDIGLIILSTPLEYVVDGYVLNQNRLRA